MSLSSDGHLLAVGGPWDNNGIGAVWIFVSDGSTGSYHQMGDKLVGSTASVVISLLPRQGKCYFMYNFVATTQLSADQTLREPDGLHQDHFKWVTM